MMSRYFVEIHCPSGSAERHELSEAHSAIESGSGAAKRPRHAAHCDGEHLRLDVLEAGCRVTVSPQSGTPVIYAGSPQTAVLVPWGDEIFRDGTRFTFLRESGPARTTNPVLLMLLLVITSLAALRLIHGWRDADIAQDGVDPPALVDERAACSEREPARAAERGRDAERAASAKQERSAFDVRDGLAALELLEEAEACFRLASSAEDAERPKAERAKWLSRLDQDYAATRVRLRAALDGQRWTESLGSVRHLQALLVRQRNHAYVRWLEDLRRHLEREVHAQ